MWKRFPEYGGAFRARICFWPRRLCNRLFPKLCRQERTSDMRRPMFVGEQELRDAQCRVGMIISNCAMLEAAVAYLEWQLVAFTWDKENPTASPADRQAAIIARRNDWNKYTPLDSRLGSASNAMNASAITERANRVPRVRELRSKWNKLREEARDCGVKRNVIGHTELAWHNGRVVRTIGRPWQESAPVSEADDEALRSEIGRVAIEISALTTELGFALPFADQDQIISVSTPPR